jgi:preprotein translocase subunit SecD
MRRNGLFALLLIIVVSLGSLGGVLAAGWSPELGLDLQGGASVIYEAGNADEIEDLDGALETSVEIIRNRVDALGVAEPEIVTQGDAIVVNLPGVDDQARALELIGRTAELRFRPVLFTYPGQDPNTVTLTPESTTTTAPADPAATTTTVATEGTSTTEAGLGSVGGEVAAAPLQDPTTTTIDPAATTTTVVDPAATTTTTAPTQERPTEVDGETDYCNGTTPADLDVPDQSVSLPGKDTDDDGVPDECFVLGPVPTAADNSNVSLVGGIVSGPEAIIQGGRWSVTLNIRDHALDLFNQIAAQCVNGDQTCPPSPGAGLGRLAIVLDGRVESAPVIERSEFPNGEIQISGDFSEREARDLALVLRFGALPIELVPQTVQTVSATLGRDSLNAGLAAGLVGVGLVILYLLLYYRALGLVVVGGMAVWAALMYSVVAWLGDTQGLALSLAGVTGVVVSIGVTVDSYVVFFERLKDEIRSGKTIRSSVDRGFHRAFRTILAANVASFIGAALLYWLTVGQVRGFAFFLGLSTLLDVIVAYGFARPAVALLARSRFFTENRIFGVGRGLGDRPAPAAEPAPAGGTV